jgi:hypothetical protein
VLHAKNTMEKELAIRITNSLAEELSICFHWKNEFNILFPEDKLQYELYNETAPNFFSYLSRFYFDYFFLKISKLLDAATMGRYENLSLYQLEKIADDLLPDKRQEFKESIDDIKKQSEIIINARNKIIAHKDLGITLNNENLGQTEFNEIESIISKMANVINKMQELLGEPKHSFVWMRDFHGASSLIQSLRDCSLLRDLSMESELFDKIEQIKMKNKYYR